MLSKVLFANFVNKIDEQALAKIICKNYIDDIQSTDILSNLKKFFRKHVEIATVFDFVKNLILQAPVSKFEIIADFLTSKLNLDIDTASREVFLTRIWEEIAVSLLPLKSDKIKVRREKSLRLASLIKDVAYRISQSDVVNFDIEKIR